MVCAVREGIDALDELSRSCAAVERVARTLPDPNVAVVVGAVHTLARVSATRMEGRTVSQMDADAETAAWRDLRGVSEVVESRSGGR